MAKMGTSRVGIRMDATTKTGRHPMSDKLSDCPFCESADVEYRFIALHWVKCNSCGAEGPGKTNKRAAIAAWNRRASPAPAILAELRGLLVE